MDNQTEPVRVRLVEEVAVDASEAFGRLRDELSGTNCSTQEDVDTVARHVSTRLRDLSRQERDYLLVMFAIERLAGVSDRAAVKIPARLLAERIADRS